jgi:serpin B
MNTSQSSHLLGFLVLASLVLSSLAGCAPGPAGVTVAQSALPREPSPSIPEGDLPALVEGDTGFGLALYQVLRQEEGNLFYSPFSISLALAMAYAGARGQTEQEMAQALRFTLPQDRLHPAFNALLLDLDRRAEEADDEAFQMSIANSIWGQQDYAFLQEYLDVLARNYGAGMRLVDFMNAPEEARVAINDWVSEETEERIQDLIPEGVIDTLTRLVLANAIYFKASWSEQFEEGDTRPQDFHLLDGSAVSVPMMHQSATFRYGESQGVQAVELPYVGDEVAMLILMPQSGGFETFESSLTPEVLQSLIASMEPRQLTLGMPKYEIRSRFALVPALAELGISTAFGSEADFSGIDGTRELYISDVVHQAFVSVDEAGTEAAAATAVFFGLTAMPMAPFELTLDRPFVFLLRDVQTGAILFAGRLVNPAE